MKQFVLPVNVERLEEGVFFAECPLIPGCHVEADTLAEAMEYLADVARVLLELMQEDGLPIPSELECLAEPRILREEVMVTLAS